MTRDRELLRSLVRIALPIAVQNLIHFGVSMADTMMLGMLGEQELAAAANANQLGFILALFTFGIGSSVNVLIAQFWGKKDVESIHKVITIMYRLLLGGGLVFTAVALFIPDAFMRVFATDAQVIALGTRYLRVLGFSYLMMCVSSATVIMLRAVGTVRVSLAVYISSLAANVFLNWVFIFGNLGAPVLGVEGAAVATCASRVVEIVIVLFFMLRVENKIRYRPRFLFRRKLGIIRDYVRNGLPVLFNELVWGLGTAVVAVVIGRMGTEFTAANSICTVLSQLVTIFIMGVGNAASVIIGNTVGTGEYERAHARARG
jgi:putative MATE family efflux protein